MNVSENSVLKFYSNATKKFSKQQRVTDHVRLIIGKIKMEYSEDIYDLKELVVSKINENLKDDLTKLSGCGDIRSELEKEKKQIESSLLLESGDVPSKISIALTQVEETIGKIRDLSEKHKSLNNSVNKYEEKVQKVQKIAADYIDKIDTLEKACNYLEIISEIEQISNSLEIALNDKNERKQISYYAVLNDILKSISNTQCTNLLLYLRKTIQYWYDILKKKYVDDFDDILKVIKWPHATNSRPVPTTETINRFQTLVGILLQIQLDQKKSNLLRIKDFSTEFEPLHLPMVELIKPLKKRFIYHFMEKRQTNKPNKPEWFFTQILTWIQQHQDFIEENVQPVYNKYLKNGTSAKIEFMRGMVEIVMEKLYYELNFLLCDDLLFSHCVDETLGFDKELKNSFGYPVSEPSVIEILTHPQIFVKWINMEKQFVLEKMDTILTSPTAFNPIVSLDWDENCVTECGNSFLTLLSTITERYEVLHQPGHKLQFLQLQLDLIDDFRVRLLQKLHEENSELLSSNVPSILNTITYVRNVLEEWGVNTLFLHLQYYKCKSMPENQLEPNGTVFDKYLILLGKMRDDLLIKVTENIFMEVKAKSMPYRKERWHAMESTKSQLRQTVTSSACPMFQVLITKLHQLQKVLAVTLFNQTLKMLANKIDQYLFEEIVCICTFNESGAQNFTYDITKNLFPLFGQYCNKPDANFELLKDSCILLSMPKGLAFSLRETIAEKQENQFAVNEVLADVGIFNLNKNDVLLILSRRIDLN